MTYYLHQMQSISKDCLLFDVFFFSSELEILG